jgi:hypothetical protein
MFTDGMAACVASKDAGCTAKITDILLMQEALHCFVQGCILDLVLVPKRC